MRDGGPFPAKLAIGFHFVDCVVHDWDFAKALGVPANVDEDLAEAALPVAAQVPDTPETRGAGRAFVAGVAVADDAPALDRVVALLAAHRAGRRAEAPHQVGRRAERLIGVGGRAPEMSV